MNQRNANRGEAGPSSKYRLEPIHRALLQSWVYAVGADGLGAWDMLRGASFIVPSVMPVTCGQRLHRPSTNAATAGFSGKMNFLGTRIVMDVDANRISPPTSPIVPCVATVKTVAARHFRLRRSSSQRRRAPIARRRWPPLRGTLAQIGGRSLLHSRGYLPRVGRYPHGHVPAPIGIVDHHGDSDPRRTFERCSPRPS